MIVLNTLFEKLINKIIENRFRKLFIKTKLILVMTELTLNDSNDEKYILSYIIQVNVALNPFLDRWPKMRIQYLRKLRKVV